MVEHLYAHIPFCPKVCPYCSFYKEASDRNKTRAFLDAMLREADIWGDRLQPRTIFFGGGTPTALSTSQLDHLISGLRERMDFSRLEEFTIEMNPATVSLEKASRLRELGVNRVSMGVQSWDPGLLETLGRVHSRDQALRSYSILREAGFDNINLDFIFGIPGQTVDQWVDTLRQTIALQPQHISAYCLTYEEDTEYFLRLGRGEFSQDPEVDAALFELTMETLEGAGYAQYEISNYARPGRECRHNLAYWLGADYIGLGPSAFSTFGGERWKNVSDTADYVARVNAGVTRADFVEPVDAATRQAEVVAFSLRTNRGVEASLMPEEKTSELAALGYLARSGDRWLLTRKGRMVADELAGQLID
ncbi:coproporphyrinogen III oxidase [Spartobacteria bacterium LR76]|nr:coproporphyrinogen III oxidase [Spartobacteria bacterium LR76]